MNSKHLYRINYYSLLALSFVLPFYQKMVPAFVAVFFITSLLSGNYHLKEKNKNILLFIVLYVVYTIGLFYSENLINGLHDIETKLSILIFPIAFLITRINIKDKLPTLLKYFVLGIILSSMLCIGEAVYQFLTTKEESELFYSKLSIFLHPSYYSMYLSMALIVVYYYYFKPNNQFNYSTPIFISLIVFLSIMIILLSSKLGILAMVIIQLTAITYWVKKYKNYLKSGITLLIIITSLLSVYHLSYSFNVRVNEFFSVLTSKNASEESTTGVRIHAWNSAIQLFKEKPLFGYGIGDVNTVLLKQYAKQELTVLSEKELNPHNQLLQTLVALGLLGGITLILTLIAPLVLAIKKSHFLYSFFILLILINLLTESILERQAGVIFYAFFNALFFTAYFSNKEQLN